MSLSSTLGRLSSVAVPALPVLLSMVAGAALAAATEGAPEESVTVIYAGQLLAIPGSAPRASQTIVIRGTRIASIRDGFTAPDDLPRDHEVIDLRDSFVMPGLIDAHTHLTIEGEVDPLLPGDAERAVTAAVNARKTLLAGFTAVRDLGSVGEAIFAVRNAINEHRIPGPRVFAAGTYISVTGGHGDQTGYREELWPMLESSGVCDGAVGCRKAVRTQVKRGADLIKLTASGGGGKPQGDRGDFPEFYDDELAAIVEAAHRLDRSVTAHAHGTSSINAALRAGVDSIEHGTFLDDESIKLFRSNGAYLIPTLSVRDRIKGELETLEPAIRERAQGILELTPDMMKRAKQGGVMVALGSDSGVVPHGQNARELQWLVDVGFTEMEAIIAGTINGARLLGMETELGTLEADKLADLIATSGNPLEDIAELTNVAFVMRDGRVYKKD